MTNLLLCIGISIMFSVLLLIVCIVIWCKISDYIIRHDYFDHSDASYRSAVSLLCIWIVSVIMFFIKLYKCMV